MAAAAPERAWTLPAGLDRWADDAYAKLTAAVAVSWVLILIAGFLFSRQADAYSEPYFVAVLLQIVYESPFQPLFLVIILVPIYLGAARNVPWPALAAGGLMMVSVVLPYARFQSLETSGAAAVGAVVSEHSSLFQLAGPGHQMPQFVSVLTLLLMGGVTAMFWDRRVGGVIGLMGLISMAFVWNHAYDNPPNVAGLAKISFLDEGLQYGYYLAWSGSAIGIIGFTVPMRIMRLPLGSGGTQGESG